MNTGNSIKRSNSNRSFFPPGGNKRPPIEKGRWASKGTKPLPDQASIQHILIVLVIHICRKVLFIATEVKITLYCIGLFFGSVLCDFLPIPKTYLSSKDNFLNIYFVKVSWGWTLIIVGAFIYLTSYTYGCGKKEIVKKNMSRIVIGSGFWLFWTRIFFEYIETRTGNCIGKSSIGDKHLCTQSGSQWHAFDISGHAFILVYINLLLVEEAKAIVGWEGIRDLIRTENHLRNDSQNSSDINSALHNLNQKDFETLKDNYEHYTPYIRLLFFLMTVMSVVSDVMLVVTVIYYHTMPQKIVGGILAMGTWYFLYKFWYLKDGSPGLPGKGLFSYQHLTVAERNKENQVKRQSSFRETQKDVPKFMGMPIYTSPQIRDKLREKEIIKDSKEIS